MLKTGSRIALAALTAALVAAGQPGLALAQPADGGEHHGGEHHGGDHAGGGKHPNPAPAPHPAAAPAPAPAAMAPRPAPAPPGGGGWNRGGAAPGWAGHDHGQPAGGAQQGHWQGGANPPAATPSTTQRPGWTGGTPRPGDHGAGQQGWAGNRGAPGGWHGGAPGHEAAFDPRPYGDYHVWSPQFREQWRGNPRYDWRGWRDAHRDAFHIGRYYAPYNGAYYSRLSIGFVLDPAFYGDGYMIYDPWTYHLPPAWPPYRWVRYYDDAVLVDTYTGQVVDVLYDFFW